jgi:hypothetical protein
VQRGPAALPINSACAQKRRYLVRHVKQHRCAICSLRETRLLDVAHVVPDAEERGEPLV